ncbi:MAG: NAD-dependent epimerase/dehydratase family protein [Actinomycetota bacterium]
MRFVVTGAAGFIGSHLTEALLADGHDVHAVDCFTDYYDVAEKEANAAGFHVDRVDLADEPLVLTGIDGVYHLAGQPGARSFGEAFPLYVRRNVLATQKVFEACAEAGVRVVFASSSSVYGDAESYPTGEDARPRPLNPYGMTKLACEQLAYAYARSFGLDVITLRYFTVYGARQRPDMFFRRVVERLLDGDAFHVYGTGEQSRSFTYVGDVVAATRAAMERGVAGATYNVGGGSEASMTEAIALLEEISGRRLAVEHEPAVKGDMLRTNADISKLVHDTGWRPGTELRDGLAAMWSWAAAKVAAE